MEDLKNYAKANISSSKRVLYHKIKERKDFNKGIILIKLLNGLQFDCNSLEHDVMRKDLVERADMIINIGRIIENYDEIEPLIKKYFSEKDKIVENDKEDYENFRI